MRVAGRIRTTPREGRRILLVGQCVLVAGVAICVALRPGLVLKRDESGLSNYGVHAGTIVPYSVALATASATSLLVGRRYRLARGDRYLLLVYGILMAGELLSTYPYRINEAWHALHLVLGFVLVTFEVLTVWWWVWRSRCAVLWWGAGVETLGLVLAVATLATSLHTLFLAESLTSLAWGWVMVVSVGATT